MRPFAIWLWVFGLVAGDSALVAMPVKPSLVERFSDVLELHGRPSGPDDRSLNLFFDNGAWHGYALRPREERGPGFVGPYWLAASGGIWLSDSFGELEISDGRSGKLIDWPTASTSSSALPGRLVSSTRAETLTLRESLIFADSSTALLRIEIESVESRTLKVALLVPAFAPGSRCRADAEDAVCANDGSAVTLHIGALNAGARVDVSDDGRRARLAASSVLSIAPGTTTTLYFRESIATGKQQPAPLSDPAELFRENELRWESYLAPVVGGSTDLGARVDYARAAVKAIETLVSNWRSAAGDLPGDGLFPSYSNSDYYGYWAWDSWKHALALAEFAPELAQRQIRSMLDAQNNVGMVPDVVYPDGTENNWRDTKPPLAALAAWKVYGRTHDADFLRAVYAQLLRYHAWWYANRDHDRDGLAQYGSTDGTLQAARWESGMDNAVRFDDARLVQNGASAWSMDQESVDLNCFLYVDKRSLASIADVLGEHREAMRLRREAARLKGLIQRRFFDPRRGFFADYHMRRREFIPHLGPEGWMPLWAEVATPAQARSVAARMMDSKEFSTYLPLPTLAADDASFAPRKGYWRGPVWIDQAYFGITGLENYGLQNEARLLRNRLLERAHGLVGTGPIFENYDPNTGEGLNTPNFSWSAGYFLLLFMQR